MWLCIKRKVNESIVIDGPAVISVQRLLSNRVILGIQAPAEVNVRRGELSPRAPADPTLGVPKYDNPK